MNAMPEPFAHGNLDTISTSSWRRPLGSHRCSSSISGALTMQRQVPAVWGEQTVQKKNRRVSAGAVFFDKVLDLPVVVQLQTVHNFVWSCRGRRSCDMQRRLGSAATVEVPQTR